jgi:ATP-dependent RNA helicase DDX20
MIVGVQQYYMPITTEDVDSSLVQIHEYEQKFKCVVDILEKIPFYQCIVFLNHRGRAVDLTQWLNRSGWASCHICAGISQQQRLEVMQKARKFRIRVLICSDLVRSLITAE